VAGRLHDRNAALEPLRLPGSDRSRGPQVGAAAYIEHMAATITEAAEEFHAAFREELNPARRAVVLGWSSFTATFATVRGITYSIKTGRGPFRNVFIGGTHIHHYLWGIGLLAGVGGMAVRGNTIKPHAAVPLAYGAGLALIVDEFALLLGLEDVYWAEQGRVSVDLGISTISAVGIGLAAGPVLRRLVHRFRHVPVPPNDFRA